MITFSADINVQILSIREDDISLVAGKSLSGSTK